MLLVEQNSFSALDSPVLAQQSSWVGLGRAELTCTLNPHDELRPGALRRTGDDGIARVQDERSGGRGLLPQTWQLDLLAAVW